MLSPALRGHFSRQMASDPRRSAAKAQNPQQRGAIRGLMGWEPCPHDRIAFSNRSHVMSMNPGQGGLDSSTQYVPHVFLDACALPVRTSREGEKKCPLGAQVEMRCDLTCIPGALPSDETRPFWAGKTWPLMPPQNPGPRGAGNNPLLFVVLLSRTLSPAAATFELLSVGGGKWTRLCGTCSLGSLLDTLAVAVGSRKLVRRREQLQFNGLMFARRTGTRSPLSRPLLVERHGGPAERARRRGRNPGIEVCTVLLCMANDQSSTPQSVVERHLTDKSTWR
jgi:hypothetical protein